MNKAVAKDFQMKTSPRQARARETIDAILSATGELLEEVGFERLSTNMVCKRAGLTPPALYRYFPNKYALLKELADRLVSAQDEATLAWIEEGGVEGDTLEDVIERNLNIQRKISVIVREFPGGLWIMRALRSVPILMDIRLKSRNRVAERVFARLLEKYPFADEDKLKIATLMSTELMNSAIGMAIEEDDKDEDVVQREVCTMIALYYDYLIANATTQAKIL